VYCEVLEAIFLHGLKATFLGRLSSRLGSEFSPRMPEPSFWTFALVFSHKQVHPAPQSFMTTDLESDDSDSSLIYIPVGNVGLGDKAVLRIRDVYPGS
jgi:hypothetical protein